MNSAHNTSRDGYTIEECVDFALANEKESGNEGLWMSRGVAGVYADGYGVNLEEFEAELFSRGWQPNGICIS